MTANSEKGRVVGITGGIASGKTAVTGALYAAGAAVVDADEISRGLTAPGGPALPALRQRFGDGVFDGAELNRRALGQLVFQSARDRRDLEEILHPMVIRETRAQIKEAFSGGAQVVYVSAPLLFEAGVDALCGQVWVVDVPEEVQIARAMARDGTTEAQARARLDSQMKREARLARASAVIDNNRPLEETVARVLEMHRALLAECPDAGHTKEGA